MDAYLVVKTLHILSSTVLFGAGLGIAFFMFRSWASNDIQEKYFAARTTVLADYCFTAPAVILQPLTGAWLVWRGGFDWMAPWLTLTYATFLIAGACWLPVVWIQIRLKQIIRESLRTGEPLPATYNKLFKIWFLLGWPAFLGLIATFFLMVAKPT